MPSMVFPAVKIVDLAITAADPTSEEAPSADTFWLSSLSCWTNPDRSMPLASTKAIHSGIFSCARGMMLRADSISSGITRATAPTNASTMPASVISRLTTRTGMTGSSLPRDFPAWWNMRSRPDMGTLRTNAKIAPINTGSSRSTTEETAASTVERCVMPT